MGALSPTPAAPAYGGGDVVVWHDVECGAYTADLQLWLDLAAAHGDPVLDVGAGTGRVALALARGGHRVIALDRDPRLIAELRRRAGELPLRAVLGDAERLTLGERLERPRLIAVPMQTIQLLADDVARGRFLRGARDVCAPRAMLAVAIVEDLATFDGTGPALPPPDEAMHDGLVYRSQPTAIAAHPRGHELRRRREVIAGGSVVTAQPDVVVLAALDADRLEWEARAAGGWRPHARLAIEDTGEHVGATVVVLRAV